AEGVLVPGDPPLPEPLHVLRLDVAQTHEHRRARRGGGGGLGGSRSCRRVSRAVPLGQVAHQAAEVLLVVVRWTALAPEGEQQLDHRARRFTLAEEVASNAKRDRATLTDRRPAEQRSPVRL